MKTCLYKIFLSCAAFSFGSGLLAQTASLSPTVTTATCGRPLCIWPAFGPVTYTRVTSNPQTISDSFSVLNPNTQYTLHIDNNSVASAVISVNGFQIFGPSDFDPHIAALDRAVILTTKNTVTVELRGRPGGSLTISVVGVDNDPPSIIELATPPPNGFGWNNTDVQINFSCSDATSGIAFCPNSLLLATEGLNQIASGTAFDRAGNSATSNIQVSIDKTPPTITASQSPAPNSAGWNNSAVTVSFNCADALSGVDSCPSPMVVSSEGANQQALGAASDKAGNIASTSLRLNIDETPPVINIESSINGATVSTANLQLTGSVSDNLSGVASVTCNGSAANVASSSFSCNITLAAGSNSIQIQAADVAGNAASAQLSVTFKPVPIVPPKATFITPTMASLLVGQSRTVKLVGEIGQLVTGATWSISDSTVASIAQSDPPQITAQSSGTATLTASFNGLSATMTVNVFSGLTLPVGTPIWSVDPAPGNFIVQMVSGNPVNPVDPDIYAIEFPNMLRAFSADGQQLWNVQLNHTPQTPAAVSVPLLQLPNTAATAGLPVPPRMGMSTLPEFSKARLLAELGPSPLQRFLQGHLLLAPSTQGFNRTNQTEATSGNSLLAPNVSNAAPAPETDFLVQTIPDNDGGTIDLIFRELSSFPFFLTTLQRIDNATQQTSWSYDSPGMITGIAIAPDNTVYGTEFFISGPPQLFFFPTHSDIVAFNGTTGQQKFALAVPPGHFTITADDPSGPVSQIMDLDTDAKLGPPSVLPDGSVNLLVYTIKFAETVHLGPAGVGCGGGFIFNSCETAVSDHKILDLLTIQPDGMFTNRPVQTLDFEKSNCGMQAGGCQDPSNSNEFLQLAGASNGPFFPEEVIPDGQGGILAAWTSTLPTAPSRSAHLHHFDVAGNSVDYTLPLSSQSWRAATFGLASAPSALILGENNVAFGSDGLSIVSFDASSGAAQLTFQPGGSQSATLVAATADGGVLGYTIDPNSGNVDAIQVFDALGTPTVFPVTGTLNNLSFFDVSTLLATTSSGQAQLVAGANSQPTPGLSFTALSFQPSFGLWFTPGGNKKQKAPVPPQITVLSPPRGLIATTVPVTISGTQLTQVQSILAGKGISVTFDPASQTGTQISATFTISPNAAPGDHAISFKTSAGLISTGKKFFVQVPTFFTPLGVETRPQACTASGLFGTGIAIVYQLTDQLRKPITFPGITPEENITSSGIQSGFKPGFAKPAQTRAGDQGVFRDDPLSACSFTPPPPNKCSFSTQAFAVVVPTVSGIREYPIKTTTAANQCLMGIDISIDPHDGTPATRYQFGVTN